MTTEKAASLVYRWVDARTARRYMRLDAMIGRTRHWLPRQVTGLDKIYPKLGLSFAIEFGRWMDVMLPIGFVVDANALDNRIARIDGHEIYMFSDMMDLHRCGLRCLEGLTRQREHAIRKSHENPDEAFVIGDIRGLSAHVREIVVRDDASASLMRPWCEKHAIPMRRH